MPAFIDKTGNVFGRLTVVARGPNKAWPGSRATPTWDCLCSCGALVNVLSSHLSTGKTTSCGCLNHSLRLQRSTKHGLYNSPENISWKGMVQRCTNPKAPAYPMYGGRGITVCERWLSFVNFYTDMGPRPERTSLDRIDNESGYSPENCRWATGSEQARNKRASAKIEMDGKLLSIIEASELLNIAYGVLQSRFFRGKRGGELVAEVKSRSPNRTTSARRR